MALSIPRNKYSTLPAVESWNTDMGILKDPPRAIHTRIREKVQDSNQILGDVQDSGDRISEAIRLFPRGVNPMATTMYNNYNGYNGGRQASNPHKVMTDGAFRPPLFRAEDLLPLSRQPRLATSVYTSADDVKADQSIVNQNQYLFNPIFIKQNPLTVTLVDTPLVFPDVEFTPVVRVNKGDIVEQVLHTSIEGTIVPAIEFQPVTAGTPTLTLKTIGQAVANPTNTSHFAEYRDREDVTVQLASTLNPSATTTMYDERGDSSRVNPEHLRQANKQLLSVSASSMTNYDQVETSGDYKMNRPSIKPKLKTYAQSRVTQPVSLEHIAPDRSSIHHVGQIKDSMSRQRSLLAS